MSILSIGIMQGRVFPKYINQLQIFPTQTWRNEVVVAKEIGFKHIELLWDSLQEIKNANGLTEFLSKPSGLPPLSVCVDKICYCNSFEDALNEIMDLIYTFKENTPPILVIPLLGKLTINKTEELQDLINKFYIHEIMILIKKYKLKLALELNMPASDIIEGLKSAEPSIFGICVDTGNLWHVSSNPIEDIHILSDKIIHVHIKDRNKEGNNVLLGNGLVDFSTFFKVLNDLNYSGIATLETNYFEDPAYEAKTNFNYISELIKKI